MRCTVVPLIELEGMEEPAATVIGRRASGSGPPGNPCEDVGSWADNDIAAEPNSRSAAMAGTGPASGRCRFAYSARRVRRIRRPNTGLGAVGGEPSGMASGSTTAAKSAISSRFRRRFIRISIRVSSLPSSGVMKV